MISSDPDEPLVWYNYQGGSGRQFFHVDERGSIIATSDASGNRLTLDTYDEYGKPGSTNSGAFQYTGQMWLPEAGVYHYKTRAYLPHLGIFGQTDPAKYGGDGPNLYAYALDDPVNFVDPLGLGVACEPGVVGGEPQTATAPVCPDDTFGGSLADLIGGMDPFAKVLGKLLRVHVLVPRCPGGPYVNFSVGASATGFAAIVGATLGVNATVSLPTNAAGTPGLTGGRISVSGTATGLAGLGLFAGFGPNGGFSNAQPATDSVSGSATPVFQLGGGWGEGAEIAAILTKDIDLSGAAGRVAVGGYAAVGKRFAGTLTSPPLGCH